MRHRCSIASNGSLFPWAGRAVNFHFPLGLRYAFVPVQRRNPAHQPTGNSEKPAKPAAGTAQNGAPLSGAEIGGVCTGRAVKPTSLPDIGRNGGCGERCSLRAPR
jgi:hypothetical protein